MASTCAWTGDEALDRAQGMTGTEALPGAVAQGPGL